MVHATQDPNGVISWQKLAEDIGILQFFRTKEKTCSCSCENFHSGTCLSVRVDQAVPSERSGRRVVDDETYRISTLLLPPPDASIPIPQGTGCSCKTWADRIGPAAELRRSRSRQTPLSKAARGHGGGECRWAAVQI
ncbi:hypothetical protein SEVIR_4G277950v4 [Setaria viridis]